MGVDNISEQPSEGIVQLVGDIDATTVNPTVTISPASRVKTQVDNTPANDTLLTTISLTVSANKMLSEGSERMFLTGGVENTTTDTVAYTATVRGLFNTNLTNPPTSSDGGNRNFKAHTNGARCILDETWLTRELQSLFNAGTTVASASAGENITIRESVSLESNGDLRLYNSVTFPNFVGIANETKTTGQATQYTTFGGLSTGHSGLTPGAKQFAENTGVITETSSSTTTLIGKATATGTAIRISLAGDATTSFSDADFEVFDNADDTKKLNLQLSDVTTATTRTLTVPDSNGKILTTGEANVSDAILRVQDNADATKQLAFEVSAITTATTRTITMPDANVDLGGIIPVSAGHFSTFFDEDGAGNRYSTDGTRATVGNDTGLQIRNSSPNQFGFLEINLSLPTFRFGASGKIMFKTLALSNPVGFESFIGFANVTFTTANPSTVDGKYFGFLSQAGALKGMVLDASGIGNLQLVDLSTSSTTMRELTLVKDGTTSVKFFADGVLKGTITTFIPTGVISPKAYSKSSTGTAIHLQANYFDITTF